jgi:hypothetical protein
MADALVSYTHPIPRGRIVRRILEEIDDAPMPLHPIPDQPVG